MQRQAPSNYIAGLGRGATGFTTRGDLGGAREQAEVAEDDIQAQIQKQLQLQQQVKEDEDLRFQDPDTESEADDDEADAIYDKVDSIMEKRRQKHRVERENEELDRFRKDRPKIQLQFADLKRQLATVNTAEWAAIPEVGDLVRKKGSKKNDRFADRFVPVPDSVLLSAQRQSEFATSVDEQAPKENTDGTATTTTNFAEFGQARDRVLGLKLDQITDSVSGSSTVDPKGYLTDLDSVLIKSDTELGDIVKARSLLRSVVNTNPKHAPGWIAAARVEQVAGRTVQARELIAKGCEECPKNEDVWLEAATLNTIENGKIILANGVRSCPQSVKIWLRATELEVDPLRKKKILRRALEFIPNSVKIWKAAISMEDDPEDARVLLSRATECVPLSVELWLALARLETNVDINKAREALNKARKLNQTSHEIWIAAAKLEESNNNETRVENIIKLGVESLAKLGANMSREKWILEAENCENSNSPMTCQAIIKAIIGINVEDEDRKSIWMEDAATSTSRGCYTTTRAIFAHAISVFPQKKSVWRRAAFFEKAHGTKESLEELLARAVKFCPQAEVLWLMSAKERWIAEDVTGARKVLEEASKSNPNSEQIWLAAIKLEVETGNIETGRNLLKSARMQADTEKVWMKSALLERHTKNYEKALEMIDEALKKFPGFAKLWIIKGQILDENMNNFEAARENFVKAIKRISTNSRLVILASRLEEKHGALIKGRALLEKGIILNNTDAELWLESCRLELRAENMAMAKAVIAKALQRCPTNGKLWAEAILMEPRAVRKSKVADAVRKCPDDPYVFVTGARLFWADRVLVKARNWFERAVKIDGDCGDSWGYYWKFEVQHGTREQQDEVLRRCVNADPRHGEIWQGVSKDVENFGVKVGDLLKIVAEKCHPIS